VAGGANRPPRFFNLYGRSKSSLTGNLVLQIRLEKQAMEKQLIYGLTQIIV
jgi:hypothetical protein